MGFEESVCIISIESCMVMERFVIVLNEKRDTDRCFCKDIAERQKITAQKIISKN